MKKIILLSLLILLGMPCAHGQALTIQGGETTVSYTPPVANITTQPTPATGFTLQTAPPFTGFNTFLLTTQPNVSVRLSITNETANACLGTFVASVSASAQASSSFNNQLQQWSAIGLITPTNALAPVVGVDLPALSTVYLSTAAISARNVAIQIVNTTGGCPTTSLDITATLTQVAVTSPLVSNTVNGFSSGLTANVQGIVPTGANGQPIFPVIGGGLSPSTNGGVSAQGIDVFGTLVQQKIDTGTAGTVTAYSATPPSPSAQGEFGIAIFAEGFINTPNSLIGPWTCIEALCTSTSAPNPATLNLAANSPNAIQTTTTLTNSGSTVGRRYNFIVFSKPPIVRQHLQGATLIPVFPTNTLIGSTLIVSPECLGTVANCTVTNVTDTQGNIWKPLESASTVAPILNAGVLSTWTTTATAAAADTVTVTLVGGTLGGGATEILELSAITPAALNQPSAPLLVDANKLLLTGGNIAGITDPCQVPGVLKSSVAVNLTTATTTQLVALIANQKIYVCGFVGTIAPSATVADTLAFEFGTGASCGTGTTLLTGTFGNGEVPAANTTAPVPITFADPGTTFSTPAGTALCALTAGTVVNVQGVLTFVQQ